MVTLDVRPLISVEPRQIGATPSEPLTFTVTVTNDTRRFLRYTATLTGLDDTHVVATPAEVDLGPGERGAIEVAATLPSFFPAGQHIAGIEVRSSDPGNPLVGFVEVEVDVQSVASARLQMPESHLRGRLSGRGTITLYNGGTQPVRFRLSGHNPEHKLRFRFAPESVVVNPGTAETVKLKVRALPRPVGGSARRAFDVVAQGPSGQLSVSGTFTHKAMIPTGFFKLLLAAAAMLLVAILIQRVVQTFIIDAPNISWQRVTTGDTELVGRINHSAVWVEFPRPTVDQPVWKRAASSFADWFTGRGRFDEGMIAWGGTGPDARLLSTGALYRSRDGQWILLPTFGAPAARTDHEAEWTGETMVIWGGRLAGGTDPMDPGAEYNPATQRWAPLPPGPLATRTGHSMTWTGNEMIIFGGRTDNGVPRSDGARLQPGALDPSHDEDGIPDEVEGELRGGTWVTMAEFPGVGRSHHTATWTGTHLVIVGGYDAAGEPLADAYAYDPQTDRWDDITRNPPLEPRACHISVWTGTSVLIVAGTGEPAGEDPCAPGDALLVDPESFLVTPEPLDEGDEVATVWTWERPDEPPPEHLGTDAVGLWTANELTIIQEVPNLDTVAALRYTPEGGTSNLPLPDPGVISTRTGFTGVWNTGSILLWGGIDTNGEPTNLGGLLILPDR